MDENVLQLIFIVDGRRFFSSSQLDNPIFHDLGFDKPLYEQNPIPMMDSPNNYALCITITRTSVRLYEGMPPRCVDHHTITHYAL